MSEITLKFETSFCTDEIRSILTRRHIAPYGRVQTVIDNEVVRLADGYVPFKTGLLKASALTSDFGSGEVCYNTPYAHKQYYFGRTFGKSGKRGKFWFERMKADHLDTILRSAKKAAKD